MVDAAVLLLAGLAVGAMLGWWVAALRARGDLQVHRAVAEVRLAEMQRHLEEQKQLLADAERRFADTFRALSDEALKSNNRAFLDLARSSLETVMAEARGDLGRRQEAIDALVKPLRESLERYERQIHQMERERQEAYGGLANHLETLTQVQQQLQRETGNLVDALKRPQVRGRWGEVTLQRVVEAAGMSRYCDFESQVSVEPKASGTIDGENGRLRPDMVVRLPGNRCVVVDAKAPLSRFLEAMEVSDEAARAAALQAHAQAIRGHIAELSSKAYWSQFAFTPDFVVLFLPGESFFSAALEQDRTLIEDGVAARVILATPTTLIALLRAVAYGWNQQEVAENARKIAEAGTELYDRVCRFAEHLARMRDGLEAAGRSFNSAVGSWEGRLVPGARRLKELGAAAPGREAAELRPVESALRQIPTLDSELR